MKVFLSDDYFRKLKKENFSCFNREYSENYSSNIMNFLSSTNPSITFIGITFFYFDFGVSLQIVHHT